jgi:hypothetical protein
VTEYISKWRKFQRLPRGERRMAARALLALVLSSIALRLLGLKRCQSALARLSPVRPTARAPLGRTDWGEPNRLRAEAIAKMVKLGARSTPLRATCLRESVALWWLLRREGIESDLRIGVRKSAGRFEAHAWVEHSGRVLNDDQSARRRFAPFDSAIAARPRGEKLFD